MLQRVLVIGAIAGSTLLCWAGCSKDQAALPTGAAGESCVRRADCASGLVCIGQVCLESPDSVPDASTSPLGEEGESCTRRADCKSGLVCSANVCRMDLDARGVGAPGETCGARSDCEEGLGCVLNVCTPDGAEGPGGQRGESCRTTPDCASPLICSGLTCVEGNYDLETTDSSCARVECTEPADCCPTPTAQCEEWQEECENGAAGANSVACTNYDNPIYNCVCDDSMWGCKDYACVARVPCESVLDCTFGVCDDGECVTCALDEDCPVVGQRCANNTCVGACETNTQCPVFNSCEDGACVPTGCLDDRECVAALNNPRAVCVDTECQTPCDRDSDCLASPVAQVFSFAACVDGLCEDLGCKTDEECKIRLSLAGSTFYEAKCLDNEP